MKKADLCSVLVKLGLAVMSVAYPQTGSQASLASAGVDVVLSVVKSVGLFFDSGGTCFYLLL